MPASWAYSSSSGGAACPGATRGQPRGGGTPNVFSSSLQHQQQRVLITFFIRPTFGVTPPSPFGPPEPPGGHVMMPNTFLSSQKHM